MATITHPTGNGYCRDRILRDRPWILDYGQAYYDRSTKRPGRGEGGV